MKIGELSTRTGVPTRMLRYYEEQGLLVPGRSRNGYRSYAEADVERARTIRSLIRSGLPTRLIAIVLEMEDGAGETWTAGCSRDFAEVLAGELTGLEERISCLTLSRDTVRTYLQRTEHAALVAERAST